MNITASREIGLHEMNEACSLIREACGSGETHVSFGVSRKARHGRRGACHGDRHGFPPAPPVEREPAIEALPAEDFFAPREPGDPLPPSSSATNAPEPVIAAPEPEPAMAAAGPGHTFDDELDVPAYLRQGKLLS